jgi:TRAP-type mannitol/chloroaromatic compound transport system permease large subunit
MAKMSFPGFIDGGPKIVLLWFAILLAVNLQTAFLTPPFGFALFYMKGAVPRTVTMLHIYRGIIPFVLLQLIALIICIWWPETVLYLPRRWGFLD